MAKNECAFCNPASMQSRIIAEGESWLSFVSVPWFREGHCLVIPKKHVLTVAELARELAPNELAAIMQETGRLADLLHARYGHGSMVMQKFQPLRVPNGVTMKHLHFHVLPRFNDDPLIPVPVPNSVEGFADPTESEIEALLRVVAKK